MESTSENRRATNNTPDADNQHTPDTPQNEKSSATAWAEFMDMLSSSDAVPEDFLEDRNQSTEERDPFEGWSE